MKNNDSNALFPACYVEFPTSTGPRAASFYLAAEEYIATQCPFDDKDTATSHNSRQAYIFTWQLKPTVVMGRNQVAHQEVDLDFCRREGIDVVRRKSGGGAIFADQRNIMTSLITGQGSVEPLFQAYAQAVSHALNQMGATTEVSGRNDIILLTKKPNGETIKGKICGNAFYHLAERNIVHGTMLYDTDPRLMQGALHPDQSKLQAAGVKSVRSRVSLLKDVLPFDVNILCDKLNKALTDRKIVLNEDDVKAIETIEREYRQPEFLYGRKSQLDCTLRQRIAGVGTLEIALQTKNGIIENLTLAGDYFQPDGDAEQAFRQAFIGQHFTPQVIEARLQEIHPEKSIRNLTTDNLRSLLLQNQQQSDN